MKKALCVAAFLALLANPAYACKQLSSEVAFIQANDKNQDQKLSKKEWRSAKLADFFVAFILNKNSEFARLDKNGDKFLTADELYEQVRYRREPCADWQEKIQQNQ